MTRRIFTPHQTSPCEVGTGFRLPCKQKEAIDTCRRSFTISIVAITIFWSIGLVAFAPNVRAATISSGDLIKASTPAVYYYAADGGRYVFPNEKTFKTWYVDFSTVKTITDAELAAIQ